jgi:hypothetical protein
LLAEWVQWLRQYVDGTLLAKIHGCTAPLYFALCTVAVVVTSRRWIERDHNAVGAAVDRVAVGTACDRVSVGVAVQLPPQQQR